MSKVAVVYWSGTGNTEEMANKVAEGAKAAGAEVEVISADDFDGTLEERAYENAVEPEQTFEASYSIRYL